MTYVLRLGAIMALAAGCSRGPGAIQPPNIDADEAAQTAIELNDRDGDGKLTKAELTASPSLAEAASRYDTNGDGALEAGEIDQGLVRLLESETGARSVGFVVVFNGRPLSGATVRLIPEPFLGDAVKGASAATNAAGAGMFDMAAEDRPANAPNVPLVQPGLYKVEVTHPSAQIPPKYNGETTIGIEISHTNPGPQGITWVLTSK